MAKNLPFLESLSDSQLGTVQKIHDEAVRQGVPPEFAIAIAEAETGGKFSHMSGKEVLTSPRGARGLMQIMPETARLYNEKHKLNINPDDEDSNISGGIFILKDLLNTHKSPLNAVVAYNTGSATRKKFFDLYDKDPDEALRLLPNETQDYISRVGGNYSLDGSSGGGESVPVAQAERQPQNAPEGEPIVPVTRMTPIGALAGAAYGEANRRFFPAEKPSSAELVSAQKKLATAEGKLRYFQDKHGAPSDVLARLQQELQAARNEFRQVNANLGEVPASSTSLVPNADQHARGLQGNVKDTGITGRASQTTYNERTAQIARNERAQRASVERLAQQGIIDPAKAYKLTEGVSASTPSGILVSPEEAAVRNAKLEAELAPRKEAISGISEKMRDARSAAKSVSDAEDKVALARIALKQAEESSPGFLKKFGYAIARNPILANALAGAGTGFSLQDAINSARQGDSANAISSGIEAGFGGLSMLPFLPAKAVGTVGGLTAAGGKALVDYLGEKYSFGIPSEIERTVRLTPPRRQ